MNIKVPHGVWGLSTMRELEKVVGGWSTAVPLLQLGYRGVTNTVLTTGSCCLWQNNLCLCVQMLLVTVLAPEHDKVGAAVTRRFLECSGPREHPVLLSASVAFKLVF